MVFLAPLSQSEVFACRGNFKELKLKGNLDRTVD